MCAVYVCTNVTRRFVLVCGWDTSKYVRCSGISLFMCKIHEMAIWHYCFCVSFLFSVLHIVI